MNMRRVKMWSSLATALLLAFPLPATPAFAGPADVTQSPAQASTDPDAIVRQIDAALKAGRYEDADNDADALRKLAQQAQNTAKSSPTAANKKAATDLQTLADAQRSRVVNAKIDSGLKAPKSDPNNKQVAEDYWEAVVASWVRPLVVQFRRKYRDPQTNLIANEIDIETQHAIIEVTLGEGRGKLDRARSISTSATANPSRKPVIEFGPKITPGITKNLEQAGFKVVRTEPELIDALREAGDPVDDLPDAKQTAEQRQKRAEQAEAASAANLGLRSCEPQAMGEDGGRIVAMAAAPMAGPCDKNKPSPLAEALASSNLGGVDFSTLGLRYMSDGSGGVRYSFSASPSAPGTDQDLDSGLDAIKNSSADLRTWLVLDPSKFWVNLNPTEPDRIVDSQLGRTNAGKALLEADLRMKRTEGKLIDPNTSLGARYWNALAGPTDKVCYSSRLWIVPGDVEVREDGSSLYVLKATLHVKAKAQHIGGGYGCDSDPASDARGERLEQTMLVPKVEEAVNTAPEYAPLRRAFLARVVAQWVRDRHTSGHRTSFDGLLDSGDLGPAVLTDGWQPRQVFDSYVRSIRDKDFTYHQTMRVGGTRVVREITYGGVDFSKLSSARLSAAQMNQRLPRLPETAKASGTHPAKASDGSIWLGETAGSTNDGLWSRVGGTVGAFVTGRTGILVLIVAALGLVTFGLRGSGRKRRA
ncbi:hypothetical protein [Actinoallomurus acaciae]|uniref:Uncharacterized protein n=1 Tax=Actinoallomurus acaciae TaxID=502577 RepID=A0ABV5YIM3_9ACTN